MPKKKQLTLDTVSGQLSRLQQKDLPLLGISGLNDGDSAPFGTLTSDIIEYCVYDLSDTYLASGYLEYPLPDNLDVGDHVRSFGYERGTYKIVYNFLRQIGGSNKFVLTKKSDKSIYTGEFLIGTDGRIYASHNIEPDVKGRLLDDKGNDIELLIQDDKFWLQEISPSRTEIRLRPNPGIVDIDYFERFRLLGYTCLSYSDISGESSITIDGNVATLSGGSISLDQAMVGGTLKIREAFVIDYEETEERISRYTPEVELETLLAVQNLVTNGHFANENGILEVGLTSGNHEIVEFSNPGASRYVLKTSTSIDDNDNQYQLLLNGIPGENYIISCWVHWDSEWALDKRQLFSGTIEAGGTNQNFNDSKDEIKVKDVAGNEWKYVYQVITLPVNGNGSFKLNLGKTSDIDQGNRYITNVQVEAGSTNGTPTSYMVSGERIEEEDSPTTGLITFIDDDKVEAVFADGDTGFTDLMVGGRLTIKDTYVVDQSYTQDSELVIIDDIPLKNQDASDILKGEREFRVSPYHGLGDNNYITLQVDNEFDLYTVTGNSETLIGSGEDWRQAQSFPLPNNIDGLRIETRNQGGPAAFIAKIVYNGQEVKTGDGSQSWLGVLTNWQRRALSSEYDIPPRIVGTGPWSIQSNSETDSVLGSAWKTLAKAGKGVWGNKVDDDLLDCSWIWSVNTANNQVLSWTWDGGSTITDLIWQWWDPVLHSDAVKPSGWGEGFNSFNWGGNEDRKNDRSQWHSGWLGHHAKWVDGDGEFGGVAMKFIDQNSEFGTPNHIDYEGIHKTANTSVLPTTLSHRWLGIAQTLPHSMASQGIKPGDQITVSWSQKSDTANKGALVGLRYYKISDGIATWGTWTGYHPSTIGDDENGEPMLKAGEREFLRYRPVSKTGKWEQVKWTGIVEENWDLNKATTLYVYGMYGPEGILWVENVQIQITEVASRVDVSPTTTDLVGQITAVDGDIATLITDYVSLSPDGTVFDNDANIQSFNTFTNFYVDYTSSIAESAPVYGSLRGDIESITGNTITLVNSYEELGEQEGHDTENTLGINQSSTFGKWFVQYPNDNQNNLSKLLRLGTNDYSLITNFKFDTREYPEYPHSLVYKLYETSVKNYDPDINKLAMRSANLIDKGWIESRIDPVNKTLTLYHEDYDKKAGGEGTRLTFNLKDPDEVRALYDLMTGATKTKQTMYGKLFDALYGVEYFSKK